MPNTTVERHKHPKYPRLTILLRADSKYYQAITFLDGKPKQGSLKTSQLPAALKLAEDWYKRELRSSVTFGRQHPIAKLTTDPTKGELFKAYLNDLPRTKQPYALQKWGPIQHFWRARLLSDVTTATFKQFYTWRRSRGTDAESLSNNSLHKDVTLVRQILKHAVNDSLLTQVPVIPPSGKIDANPRPWLTLSEYKHLVEVGIQRIGTAPNARVREQRRDLHELIGFLHHSMMRVGELRNLRYRDCKVMENKDEDTYLVCEVTGKRGTRTCVTRTNCAVIYEQRVERLNPEPDDLVFEHHSRDAFRELLVAAKLRTDARGFERNLKSIRATAISHMLLFNKNVNLLMVARNAGTSVAMIDQFYARRLRARQTSTDLSCGRVAG